MKQLVLFIAGLVLAEVSLGQFGNCLKNKDQFIEISKESSFITSLIQNSVIDPTIFIKRKNCSSRFLEYPKAVHETLHVFNSSYQVIQKSKPRDSFRFYLISTDSVRFIEKIKNLPTSKIIGDTVSEEKWISALRINTYLIDSIQDSSKNGIYGLLEEFSAYRISMESFNTLFSYSEQFDSKWLKEHFPEFYVSGNNVVMAYFEFHAFINYYLRHLSKTNKINFDNLMNSEFIELFSFLDKKFANEIEVWKKETTRYVSNEGSVEIKNDMISSSFNLTKQWHSKISEINYSNDRLKEIVLFDKLYIPEIYK
ncbi:MAG: hypothetical protein AAF487_04595 [Bacteroidota bacterium]